MISLLLTTEDIFPYVTRVVDESGRISPHGCVDHGVVINLEHVAADPSAFVILLPLVRQDGSDLLPSIFDHHLTSLNFPFAVKAAPVNLGSKENTKTCEIYTR